MPTTFLRDALWYGGVILQVMLLARLFRLGLIDRYPVLASYLAFDAAQTALRVYLYHSGLRLFGLQGYGLFYFFSQPVLWTLYFLLMLELYSLMLAEFPGFRRLGRLTMYSSLGAVALSCCLLMVLDQQAGFDSYPWLTYLILQERSVFLCLSLLALLLLVFAHYYRLYIKRNVWVLLACLGSYFLVGALLLTLREHFGSSFAPLRNLANAAWFFCALLGALLFVSRAGETEARPLRVTWGRRNQQLEASLFLQLQSFNHVLVKVLRQ